MTGLDFADKKILAKPGEGKLLSGGKFFIVFWEAGL
jgi:hypothetical protein